MPPTPWTRQSLTPLNMLRTHYVSGSLVIPPGHASRPGPTGHHCQPAIHKEGRAGQPDHAHQLPFPPLGWTTVTETHPHHGRIPTGPVNLAVGTIFVLLMATQLTPDQADHLLTMLGIPGTVLGLAQALKKA